MDILICVILIVIGLIVYGIGYNRGIASTGLKANMECDIFVQSRRTGEKYHATRYRLSGQGLEIMIYNHFPGEFEWHSVWHFESATQISAYLMPDYAREHYNLNKMPNFKNNDFTRTNKKCYNMNENNKKGE